MPRGNSLRDYSAVDAVEMNAADMVYDELGFT